MCSYANDLLLEAEKNAPDQNSTDRQKGDATKV